METKLRPTSGMPMEFTLQRLKHITDDFSSNRIVGRGGCGVVYKGVLDNGEEIAVKKLYRTQRPGLDNDKQFKNECTNLTRAQHKNIVRLVGYCYEIRHELVEHNGEVILAGVEERILCFEYLQGGSLENHLSDESHGLNWCTRYKIIKGICEGLHYLHNGCNHPVYHLDLKPGNILLDEDMAPKIGDFGLSRLFDSTQTHVTSKVIGTRGYMPPEYITSHKITNKFDIFSLGVIIIQIVAGPEGYTKSDEMPSQRFIDLVHGNWCKRFQETMPAHTSQEIKTARRLREEIQVCIEIALRCVEPDREERPTISEILDELNKFDTSTLNELNKMSNIANNSSISQDTVDLKGKQVLYHYRSSKWKLWTKYILDAGIFPNTGGKDGNSYGCRTSSALVPPNVKIFNFEDLRSATKNFRPDSVLGEGEHWGISKGWIDEETLSPCLSGLGMAIAVQTIHVLGLQGRPKLLAKVHYLGMFTHRNLVKLIGYCTTNHEVLLVCEYMQRGSLENHLSRRSCSSPLSWNLRLKVALGAAKGLAFLHSAKIVYRDMRTRNILLDTAYDAKLSCFGSNGPIDERGYVSTAATLTYACQTPEKDMCAYAAPDDLSTGELTVQSDIYGFGVVLLELLTGRCAFDINRPKGEQNLVEWARPHLINRRKIRRLVDTRLGGEYSTGGVNKVAALALECLALDAKMRPSMDEVVSVLEGIVDSIDQDQDRKRAHLKSNGKGKMWTFG